MGKVDVMVGLYFVGGIFEERMRRIGDVNAGR